MNTHFLISEKTWGTYILFVFPDSENHARKVLPELAKKYIGMRDSINNAMNVLNSSNALCASDGGMAVIVVPRDRIKHEWMGSLVHEMQHAVFNMLDYRGVKHTGDSDEAYSYLIGYYAERIFQKLKIK